VRLPAVTPGQPEVVDFRPRLRTEEVILFMAKKAKKDDKKGGKKGK
jgi:hypothetical protein